MRKEGVAANHCPTTQHTNRQRSSKKQKCSAHSIGPLHIKAQLEALVHLLSQSTRPGALISTSYEHFWTPQV